MSHISEITAYIRNDKVFYRNFTDFPHATEILASSSSTMGAKHIHCPYHGSFLQVSPSDWVCCWFIIPTHQCQPVVGCSVGTIWWSMGARRSHKAGVPKRCLVFSRLLGTNLVPPKSYLSQRRGLWKNTKWPASLIIGCCREMVFLPIIRIHITLSLPISLKQDDLS